MTPNDRQLWLSITPEPEGELPEALATLRAGGAPDPERVQAERERIERLVAGARRRAYKRWLAEARGLSQRQRPPDPRVDAAARLTQDVLDNHDALELGLEPRRRAGRGGRNR